MIIRIINLVAGLLLLAVIAAIASGKLYGPDVNPINDPPTVVPISPSIRR